MVSGVSFKNPHQNTGTQRHKKIASMGLVVMFVILILVFVAYGIGVYLKKSAQETQQTLEKQIAQMQKEIDTKLAEPSRFVNALHITEQQLYDGNSPEVILSALESTMVPRVVLLSAKYTIDRSAGGDRYLLSLTGDFETYDVFAAQIDAWKKDQRFSAVRVGSVEPSEETGRLVFAVTMTMTPPGEGDRPYDQPLQEDVPQEDLHTPEGEENSTLNEGSVLQEPEATKENAPADGTEEL